MTTDKAADFVECLSHMAVPGDCVEDDFPTYATKWIQQVNGGGLFVGNNQAFALFRQIEVEIRDTLPNLLGPNFTAGRYAGQLGDCHRRNPATVGPPCCRHR